MENQKIINLLDKIDTDSKHFANVPNDADKAINILSK